MRQAALVSDESALEACIRDDALYKLTTFTFFTFVGASAGARVIVRYLRVQSAAGVVSGT